MDLKNDSAGTTTDGTLAPKRHLPHPPHTITFHPPTTASEGEDAGRGGCPGCQSRDSSRAELPYPVPEQRPVSPGAALTPVPLPPAGTPAPASAPGRRRPLTPLPRSGALRQEPEEEKGKGGKGPGRNSRGGAKTRRLAGSRDVTSGLSGRAGPERLEGPAAVGGRGYGPGGVEPVLETLAVLLTRGSVVFSALGTSGRKTDWADWVKFGPGKLKLYCLRITGDLVKMQFLMLGSEILRP
ncbi:translation initiation factor IF-2-like [Fukomys damarensis]|uniref:translation initiation factor IF-2-like n=1 Tax=Fukomys damarensis TaxID=885580 RepID=UPI001455167D|nr:translation initiation factor IF-2-like [Fukomys damarensis]